MSSLLLCGWLILFAPAACKDWQPSGARSAAAVLRGDTTSHVLSGDDRDLIVRARAYDRANQLDSARAYYERAAEKTPAISDWLYLRAAGVTRDSSSRSRYYAKVRSAPARDRIGATEAQARERADDIVGAIRQFAAIGARLSVLRLRAAPGVSDADRAAARADLLQFISRSSGGEDTRDGIALFDQLYPKRIPAEALALARAATSGGVSSRAAIGYAAAFASGLGTSTDRFHYGMALARLNNDAAAAAQFAKVRAPAPLAAAATYQRGRAFVAMGNVAGARRILRGLVAASPRDTSSAAALLLLSDLATDEGRDDDARSTLLSLVKRFPGARQSPTARFRAAMIAFIQRDYRDAASEMDALAAARPKNSESEAASYWAGKSYTALNDPQRARAHWRSAIADDPLGYYGVLAAKKLDTTLVRSDNSSGGYPSVPAVDSAMTRVASLEDAGMDTEAGFEYNRLYREATISQPRLLATAHALSGTEQSEWSIALAKKALDQIGATPANLRLYFPVVERQTLISSAKEDGLDPILVAALIRQESSFNPRANSPVGARGLMQVMPSVGRSIAAKKGIGPWNPDLLYDPAINIRLGTSHLSGLVHEYASVERVLAAYNAGESRVGKWASKAGANDPEIFTERIPFVETRDYVRAVMRNREYYRLLYPW